MENQKPENCRSSRRHKSRPTRREPVAFLSQKCLSLVTTNGNRSYIVSKCVQILSVSWEALPIRKRYELKSLCILAKGPISLSPQSAVWSPGKKQVRCWWIHKDSGPATHATQARTPVGSKCRRMSGLPLVMSLAEGATARSFPVLKKMATNAACLQPVTRIYFRLATLRLLQWTFLCTERTSAWQRLQSYKLSP